MLKSCENTGANEYTLEIALEAAEFEAAAEKEFTKKRNSIVIPGFRKGKAPRRRVEMHYGKDYFYREALDTLFPAEYEAATADFPHEIVAGPQDFDIRTMGPEGLDLTFVLVTKPEISIEGYKGLAAVRPEAAVSDEEVEADLHKKQQDAAREVPLEGRAAQNGDVAAIDFEGFTDGVPFEGGKGENYNLELGSGQFIPGFEEQIVGHNVGDEFDVNVTFPEDYTESLSGKPAVFKVKLNSLLEKQIPALDNDFAADLGFDTLDELKADIRATLLKSREESAKTAFENDIYEQLAALVKEDVPACMIDESVDRMVDEFKRRLQASGIPFESYLGYLNMTEESLRESYRERAEKDIRIELALEKIAELEAIEIPDEDTEKEIADIAERYKKTVDEVKDLIDRNVLIKEMKRKKAAELVLGAAQVLAPAEDAPAEKPKKAPAKKTAKKKAEEAPAEEAPAEEAPAEEAPAKPKKKAPAKKPAKKTAEEAAPEETAPAEDGAAE